MPFAALCGWAVQHQAATETAQESLRSEVSSNLDSNLMSANSSRSVLITWSAARLQGLVWARRQVCTNVFGLQVEIDSPGQDEMHACLSLLVARSSKTISRIRLRTRRCDCSFVLAAPVQTFGGGGTLYKLVVVVRESGKAKRFQAQGVFSSLAQAGTAGGLYSLPLDSTAHAIRASLFAIATTTTFLWALASSRSSQAPMETPSRLIRSTAARLP